VLAILPHISESEKDGRIAYLDMLMEVARKLRGHPYSFLWSEGGAQQTLETEFGVTFGYPALVAFSVVKQAYAVLQGSFSKENIKAFLDASMPGKQPLAKMPSIVVRAIEFYFRKRASRDYLHNSESSCVGWKGLGNAGRRIFS
jgi:hypothetical protein